MTSINPDWPNAEKDKIQKNDLLTSLSSIGYNQNTLNVNDEINYLSQNERDLILCLLSDDIRDKQYSRIKTLTS